MLKIMAFLNTKHSPGFSQLVSLVTLTALLGLIAITGIAVSVLEDNQSTENRSLAAPPHRCESLDQAACDTDPGCDLQTGEVPCSTLTSEIACRQESGCNYIPGTSCSTISGEATCRGTAGCNWNPVMTSCTTSTCDKPGCSCVEVKVSCNEAGCPNNGICYDIRYDYQRCTVGDCSREGCNLSYQSQCIGPSVCQGLSQTACNFAAGTGEGCTWSSTPVCTGKYPIGIKCSGDMPTGTYTASGTYPNGGSCSGTRQNGTCQGNYQGYKCVPKAPTSTPTPTKAPISCTDGANTYKEDATACSTFNTCVRCTASGWVEIDRSKCMGLACGPADDSRSCLDWNNNPVAHNEYACGTLNSCAQCVNGNWIQNVDTSYCAGISPCGPTPIPSPTSLPNCLDPNKRDQKCSTPDWCADNNGQKIDAACEIKGSENAVCCRVKTLPTPQPTDLIPQPTVRDDASCGYQGQPCSKTNVEVACKIADQWGTQVCDYTSCGSDLKCDQKPVNCGRCTLPVPTMPVEQDGLTPPNQSPSPTTTSGTNPAEGVSSCSYPYQACQGEIFTQNCTIEGIQGTQTCKATRCSLLPSFTCSRNIDCSKCEPSLADTASPSDIPDSSPETLPSLFESDPLDEIDAQKIDLEPYEEIVAQTSSDPIVVQGYAEASSCQEDPFNPEGGRYTFAETPIIQAAQTSCQSGYSITCGIKYTDPTLACLLKSSLPNTYEYCRRHAHDGVEYCTSPQSSLIDSQKTRSLAFVGTAYAQSESADPTSTYARLASLQPLDLVELSLEDILSLLGQPQSTLEKDGKTVLVYVSSDPSRNNLIHLESNGVTLIQAVPTESQDVLLAAIINEYGIPEVQGYTTHGYNTLVYAYPSLGRSYHFTEFPEKYFKLQMYQPISVNEFNQGLGAHLQVEPYRDNLDEIVALKADLTQDQESENPTIRFLTMTLLILSILALGFIGFLVFRNREMILNQLVTIKDRKNAEVESEDQPK